MDFSGCVVIPTGSSIETGITKHLTDRIRDLYAIGTIMCLGLNLLKVSLLLVDLKMDTPSWYHS